MFNVILLLTIYKYILMKFPYCNSSYHRHVLFDTNLTRSRTVLLAIFSTITIIILHKLSVLSAGLEIRRRCPTACHSLWNSLINYRRDFRKVDSQWGVVCGEGLETGDWLIISRGNYLRNRLSSLACESVLTVIPIRFRIETWFRKQNKIQNKSRLYCTTRGYPLQRYPAENNNCNYFYTSISVMFAYLP